MDNPSGTGKIVHASDAYFCCHELKENGKLDMEKTMSSLNKIRILENDVQKKTNPNSNASFELGVVDSLKGLPLFGSPCKLIVPFPPRFWTPLNLKVQFQLL